MRINPYFFAFFAIGLWSSLASLSVSLSSIPPLLLTGVALCVGSVLSWGKIAAWRVSWITVALGVYGLLGYHFLLFLAFRYAPAVEANLLNYLWPLFIVLFAPFFQRNLSLQWRHLIAGLLGFLGAGVAIYSGAIDDTTTGPLSLTLLSSQTLLGFGLATGAAFIWATYSLGTRCISQTKPFSTAAIGLFSLISGLGALACHALFEKPYTPNPKEWTLMIVLGLGPLGAAFYAWDIAMKRSDPRVVGLLSFATPLLSTSLLLWVTGRPFSWFIGLSALLIVSSAWVGLRKY